MKECNTCDSRGVHEDRPLRMGGGRGGVAVEGGEGERGGAIGEGGEDVRVCPSKRLHPRVQKGRRPPTTGSRAIAGHTWALVGWRWRDTHGLGHPRGGS